MSDRDQVRNYVKSIEALEEQIAEFNSDKSEFYKSAKDVGLNVKALRRLISERRKKAKDRAGFEELENDLTQYEIYLFDDAPRARAHEGLESHAKAGDEAAARVAADERLNGSAVGAANPAESVSRPVTGRTVTATSELMDATAGETAPIPEPDIPLSLRRYHPQQETV